MLLLQSGQLGQLAPNLQAILLQNQVRRASVYQPELKTHQLATRNQGLFQQGFMQQSLQNLTGQGLSLPQVAAAAQQLQQLQESQQLLQQHAGQRESTKPPATSVNTPLATSKSQQQQQQHHQQQQQQHIAHMLQQLPQGPPIPKAVLTSPAQMHEKQNQRQASPIVRKDSLPQENQNNKSNTVALTAASQPGAGTFPVRSRSEPSPEEMTDLEELEQFAKMFKQRRIKLGKQSRAKKFPGLPICVHWRDLSHSPPSFPFPN